MNIRLERLDDNICQLIFDRPESAANVFDRATMEELDALLDQLAGDSTVKGLIFSTAKPRVFMAGADIRELLASDLSEEDLRQLVRRGQQVFSRIAALPILTVAAIHGACLGGGYELCLACDYRIASDDKATKIGLPETSLGILPGWGGCTRLPWLVGLPGALDLILKGRRMPAKQARKKGAVDEVVPKEHLLRRARARVAEGEARRPSRRLYNNALVARLVARRVGPELQKKTRGHYPAMPRALEVITRGVTSSIAGALQLEQDAICTLARTEVCRNLVRVFFLQERAKRLRLEDLAILEGRTADEPAADLPGPIAVVGAGVMGAGIAQWLSARGRRVVLKDVGEEPIRKGLATASKLYADAVKRHIFTRAEARQGLDRIAPATGDVPLHHAAFVVEAATENMEIKKKIFTDLLARTGPETILATNTSALSISELGEHVGAPERVIGIHFFNPVSRMQLVEIVVGRGTSPATVERTLRMVQQVGKMPVVVKDRPGFVVNRILMPYLTEAGHLFEQGATASDLDEAMLDFGMPMGPLRLLDEVGVDVAHHVATFFSEAFGDRMPVPDLLAGMMEAGWLGRKSGSGFYTFANKKGDPPEHDAMKRFVKGDAARAFRREDLGERMALVMLNEAARCMEEGIVSGPEDIDFAMIMGTGFAPFRGGPLRYADALGPEKVVAGLNHLADEDPRFAPCALLVDMARTKKTFYREDE